MRKNLINGIFLMLAICLFLYGMWQHELTVINTVWGTELHTQPFYFWYPYIGTTLGMAYDVTMAMEIVAFFILFLALWFWNSSQSNSSSLCFKLDPTVPRIVSIAILLFIEALFVPAYSLLQENQMPTMVQWLTFLVGAILQLVTYLLAFMGVETKKEETK